VIDSYHKLFEVKKSFRMSKSDLKARPVYHHKRDSIEAHMTVVFAALAVARHIEAVAGVSIKKFIRMLEPFRTGIISVNGISHTIKPRIPEEALMMISRLK